MRNIKWRGTLTNHLKPLWEAFKANQWTAQLRSRLTKQKQKIPQANQMMNILNQNRDFPRIGGTFSLLLKLTSSSKAVRGGAS